MGPEVSVWMFVAGQLILGAAIWGGIRADIRGIHTRLEHVEKSANDAHTRIDKLFDRAH